MCTGGETTGPVSGTCPGWRYGKCPAMSLDALKATVDGQAANALGDLGNSSNAALDAANAAKSSLNGTKSSEVKNVGILHHLKAVIAAWKAEKAAEMAATKADEAAFGQKVSRMKTKRMNTMNALNKLIDTEFADELATEEAAAAEEASLAKLGGRANATDGILNTSTTDGAEPASPSALGLAMANLDNFLSNATMSQKALLSSLHKAGGKKVADELHKAALRKMERQETTYYACTYLLEGGGNTCVDFAEKYAGVERVRELTTKEHTRVCDDVSKQLEKATNKPAAPETPGAQKDLYFSWCVKNVRL